MRTTIAALSLLLLACDTSEAVTFRQEPGDPLPPNTALSPELELCVLKLDLCVTRAEVSACGFADEADRSACSVQFDECGYKLDDYHEPSCRMTYAVCRLELSDDSPKWYHLLCQQAVATCS